MKKATELDALSLQLKLSKATYGYKCIPHSAYTLLWNTAIELLKIQGYDVSELEKEATDETHDN